MNVTKYLSPSFSEGAFASLRSSVGQIRNAYGQARARRAVFRRTYDELTLLSDRELSDIGIPRALIRRTALEQSRKVTHHG